WSSDVCSSDLHVAPTITEAAKAAGRPEPRVVCALPLCVTNDVEEAREQAGRTFEVYGTLPSYRAMMDREGVDGPADLAIVGDEDTVASKLEELAEAGVTDFVANEYMPGESHGRTRASLKSFMERCPEQESMLGLPAARLLNATTADDHPRARGSRPHHTGRRPGTSSARRRARQLPHCPAGRR